MVVVTKVVVVVVATTVELSSSTDVVAEPEVVVVDDEASPELPSGELSDALKSDVSTVALSTETIRVAFGKLGRLIA